jgi:hypothetical protein
VLGAVMESGRVVVERGGGRMGDEAVVVGGMRD